MKNIFFILFFGSFIATSISLQSCAPKTTCPAFSSQTTKKQPSLKETKVRRKQSNGGRLF